MTIAMLSGVSADDLVNVQNTRGGVQKWVPGMVIRWLWPLTLSVPSVAKGKIQKKFPNFVL